MWAIQRKAGLKTIVRCALRVRMRTIREGTSWWKYLQVSKIASRDRSGLFCMYLSLFDRFKCRTTCISYLFYFCSYLALPFSSFSTYMLILLYIYQVLLYNYDTDDEGVESPDTMRSSRLSLSSVILSDFSLARCSRQMK